MILQWLLPWVAVSLDLGLGLWPLTSEVFMKCSTAEWLLDEEEDEADRLVSYEDVSTTEVTEKRSVP